MNEQFANVIRQRIYQRVPLEQLAEAGIKEFYVAGNSLNKQPPNDIDIFPVGNLFTQEQAEKLGNVVSSTKNAITVKVGLDKKINHQTVDGQNEIEVSGKNIVVQLCNYQHGELESLVNSFDFSHIQIGAKVDNLGITVYYTKEYENAKMCQSTEYVGSEYPLSSMIRMFKYAKRGDFAGNSHIFSAFKIVTDVVDRGFDDFDDFKNQLDAIDLGLVPENQKELVDAGLASEESGLDFSEEGKKVLNKLMSFLILSKKAICKDAQAAYDYAQSSGERFEKGEDAISKDEKLALAYAKNILKGRFEKGEEAISNNPYLVHDYWCNVINKSIHVYGAYNNSDMQKLPEFLHNKMIAYGMDNNHYAKDYLFRISKIAA